MWSSSCDGGDPAVSLGASTQIYRQRAFTDAPFWLMIATVHIYAFIPE
jgi:hypothetical protein